MRKDRKYDNRFLIALLWLLLLILLPIAVLWPVFSNQVDYLFYFDNILFITLSVLFLRYIFFLKFTWIKNTIIPKLILLFAGIVSAVYSYYILNKFTGFYNDNGIYHSLDTMELSKQYFLGNYIYRQFIFFASFTIVTGLILPIKMLVSVWRVFNKGTE